MMEKELLRDVLALAVEAGRAVMAVYDRADGTVDYKADNSPLTQADLDSHRVICDGLAQRYPEIPILSEESAAIAYDERKHWQRFWLVDPLDGTKEFIKRNGEFTVNIALIEGDKAVLGVVVAPALGVSYYAAQGVGAFKSDATGERPIRVAEHQDGEPWRVVSSRSHADERTQKLLAALGEDSQCLSSGSSLKLGLVADGSAHLYPRLAPTMEWDIAAGQCVVEQAGGVVVDVDGGALLFNKPNLLNPEFLVAGQETILLVRKIAGCIGK